MGRRHGVLIVAMNRDIAPLLYATSANAGIHDQAPLLQPREHVLTLVRIGHVWCLARERIVNFPVGQTTSFSSAGSIKPAASSSATTSSLCLHHMKLPTTRVSQNAWPDIHSASLGGTSGCRWQY